MVGMPLPQMPLPQMAPVRVRAWRGVCRVRRRTSLLGLRCIQGEGRRGKTNHAVCLGQFFLHFLDFLGLLSFSVPNTRRAG